MVLQPFIHAVNKTNKAAHLPNNLQKVIQAWSSKHAKDDAALGALLPEHTQDFLEKSPQGQQMLLKAIDVSLSCESSIHDISHLLRFLKSIEDMSYCYLEALPHQGSQKDYQRLYEMIFPSDEELDMRMPRQVNMLAITYGIEAKLNQDLIPMNDEAVGCVSGKARVNIFPAEQRFAKLMEQEKKCSYYNIPAEIAHRKPVSYYANRYKPWFEKLATVEANGSQLPLIASVSASTPRLLIMLQHLGIFTTTANKFDIDKAQIIANCFMGYFIFCGHHSYTEVMEVWNRLLDYIAIEYPDQLPKNMRNPTPTDECYMSNNAEQQMPYGKIADYESFMHVSYAKEVIDDAEISLRSPVSWSYSNIHNLFSRRNDIVTSESNVNFCHSDNDTDAKISKLSS